MKDTMQKMEMVKGEDVERSKMDKETYVDHIVACVDVYLDGTKRQYLQRRGSSTNPYSLQTIEQEVYELEPSDADETRDGEYAGRVWSNGWFKRRPA
jgi:hypothetical protein